MKVLVCGGREFDGWNLLSRTLSGLHAERPFSLVIHGGAGGADRLAGRWADHAQVQLAVFPANWRFNGKKAGPLRNQAMLDHGRPELVVAFPGGRGTADMVGRARRAGVEVLEVTGAEKRSATQERAK